ncbi:MAG: phycobilisome linker polypeptide [Cyanobacteria bacterium P01_F01_bin.53]
MLGQCATSTGSTIDNRIFVYEVTGLNQNDLTARLEAPIRSSQNQFFQVPFHRMNDEMRRITMLGGEIIKIAPLGANPAPSQPAQAPQQDSAKAEEKSAE